MCHKKSWKSLNCLDELLIMEEESGNFSEAAEIAKARGDILHEADLLGKAGHFSEACMLFLKYVFANSMWISRNKGWPLKHFPEEKEILYKAQSFAKNESDVFYKFVCWEASILSNEETNLFLLKQSMNASQSNKSLTGEIVSTRRILDVHLHSSASEYDWEDGLAVDLSEHFEQTVSLNRVSVQTLIWIWNLWKAKVESIFQYLSCLENQDFSHCINYDDFCLNYFGVRRQVNSYFILNPDAYWVKDIPDRFLQRTGKLVSADARHFVSAARNHWQWELLSVGLKMLETLEALHKLSIKNSMSGFCQSIGLVYIFEVTKFLGSKYLDFKYRAADTLHNFLNLSFRYFEKVFPLDWQQSTTKDMTSLRASEASRNLLEEVILENISFRGKLTYGQIGRVVMILLGSGKPTEETYKKILKRFDMNPLWREVIADLSASTVSGSSPESASGDSIEAPREVCFVSKFHEALQATYNADWREQDSISPSCLMYLLERLLMLAYSFHGFLFTTKSSLVEWLACEQPKSNQRADVNYMRSLTSIFDFVANIIHEILNNKPVTVEWIKKSKLNYDSYYPLLFLRLVEMLCLLCLNTGKYYDLLYQVLGRNDMFQLPKEFYDVFKRARKCESVNIIAEAFVKTGNPLLMVRLGEFCSKPIPPHGPHAIFVDFRVTHRREDILEVLFPEDKKAPRGHRVSVMTDTTNSGGKELPSSNENQEETAPEAQFSESATLADQKMITENINEGTLKMSYGYVGEISNAFRAVDNEGEGNVNNFVSSVSKIKLDAEKITEASSEAPCGDQISTSISAALILRRFESVLGCFRLNRRTCKPEGVSSG